MNKSRQLPNQAKTWILSDIKDGLDVLIAAYRYQRLSDVGDHQYAVEIERLREQGLNANGLRWLMENELVTHLIEMSLLGDLQRVFREGGAMICPQSCFDLTEEGRVFAESLANTELEATPGEQEFVENVIMRPDGMNRSAPEANGHRPIWDSERQELWFRNQLVKRYRLPSPNQVAIISAFNEDGWPSRIDDPLSQSGETEPKRRLQDTIRNLNRSMKAAVMKFLGDGSGEGILWEVTSG